jgi:hypothetical protein
MIQVKRILKVSSVWGLLLTFLEVSFAFAGLKRRQTKRYP